MRDAASSTDTATVRPTTADLLKYFLYLGSLGFGGPVALVGYMQRDLVERRRWFSAAASCSNTAGSTTSSSSTRSRSRMLTPGPIVITVAFIGYLVAAFPGALAVAGLVIVSLR